MKTRDENDDYKPNDYTLERWIAGLLGLLMFLPWIANGQEIEPKQLPTVALHEVRDASLLLKTSTGGVYVVAPTIRTDVLIRVAGPVVRTRVQQTFSNPTDRCVEGLYVFPMPELSAVDTMRMTIGSRVITGEIREREEAKRVYEQAKSEGRRAALVQQHRPNIFTTAVASLLPGQEAVIEIEYQESAHFENGEYRLRFPMVVAARYAATQAPPDSSANRNTGDLTLTVDLQPGHSVRDVRSSHHRVRKETLGHNHYRLALDRHVVPDDRDFELVWQPDLGSAPAATILTERHGHSTYALLMVTPPAHPAAVVGREAIFIVDSSGSMHGDSMEQAREALLLALDDLRPGDTFNVIDFDSSARALFPSSRPAQADLVDDAKAFVQGLSADGGTEMLKAIRLALPAGPITPGTVRQVVFITDGQVGNEQALFRYIREHLGESRLFTVGIGSAPNSHFMRNAARFGRGTFTYIGDVGQVRSRMSELFEKLGSPVMTAIDVRVATGQAEVWPSRVPDLYRGEPLVVTMRVSDPDAAVVVQGRIGNQPWSTRQQLTEPLDDSGIGKLWARLKIESAMDRLSEGVDADVVRQEVIPVALQHGLVSQYTSLVAVDSTPHGLAGATCAAEMLENGQPTGSTAHGTLPQTATPAHLFMILGLMLIGSSVLVRRLCS